MNPLKARALPVAGMFLAWATGSAAFPADAVAAATIAVTTTADESGEGQECSLREAIRSADTDAAVGGCPTGQAGRDVITVPAGRYEFDEFGADDTAENGDLDITDDLTVRGAGANATIVDAAGIDRAFHVRSPASASISGLTIRGGVPATGTGSGGGIGVDSGAALTVSKVTVTGNSSAGAGGIRNAGSLTVVDSRIIGNTTEVPDVLGGAGAGIFTGGTLTVIRSDVLRNTADGAGGGIHAALATVSIKDSVISGNVAGIGGAGLNLNTATVTLSRTTISGNQSRSVGGGIALINSTLTVSSSELSGNRAIGSGGGLNVTGTSTITVRATSIAGNLAGDDGAGVRGTQGTATFVNSTISGNRADDNGGGINANPGGAGPGMITELRSVTVTGNVADADRAVGGGGGGVAQGGVQLRLANTILAGNVDRTGEAPECTGSPTSLNFNVVGSTTGCTFIPASNDQVVGDPFLGPLQDNGGATPTHAVLPGSPSIGAGNSAPPGSSATACPKNDQRGVPRKECDVGAYERVLCFGFPVDIVGTFGTDHLAGTSGPDVILSLPGNDTIHPGRGADRVCAGRGTDHVFGERDDDRLGGGDGQDALNGGRGRDLCVGGPGADTAVGCERRQSI